VDKIKRAPHPRALPTPPEEISLNQFLLYILLRISTFRLYFYLYFCFHDSGVGGGAMLSWPRFFLLPGPRLILSRHNTNCLVSCELLPVCFFFLPFLLSPCMIDKPYSIIECYLDIIKTVYSTGTIAQGLSWRARAETHLKTALNLR